ncbi:hypothetical protein NL676_007192 [Syzygium grande]|nr:hypothetical protein NL676_007192 [Syzygium grande]
MVRASFFNPAYCPCRACHIVITGRCVSWVVRPPASVHGALRATSLNGSVSFVAVHRSAACVVPYIVSMYRSRQAVSPCIVAVHRAWLWSCPCIVAVHRSWLERRACASSLWPVQRGRGIVHAERRARASCLCIVHGPCNGRASSMAERRARASSAARASCPRIVPVHRPWPAQLRVSCRASSGGRGGVVPMRRSWPAHRARASFMARCIVPV